MRSLEAEAHTEYWANPGGVHMERVAIGFQSPSDPEDVVWFAMHNEADPEVARSEGRGEFYVSGEAVSRVIVQAVAEGMEAWGRILWHTHVATTGPSAEDVAEFPRGLFDIGMIYHVPSDTTTLYNQDGIISPVSPTELATIATTED